MTGLERKYIELKHQVRGLLSSQRCVILTTDMWTSIGGDGYFSLTAHFITDEFLMYSSQLQCRITCLAHTIMHTLVQVLLVHLGSSVLTWMMLWGL